MGKFQFIQVEKPIVPVKKLDLSIVELIKRRRRQILVNSAIYYRFGTSLVEDKVFDSWGYELRDLQKKYPNESKDAEYYDEFKDWDGTTGYDLPLYPFLDKAKQLIEFRNKMEEEDAKIRN